VNIVPLFRWVGEQVSDWFYKFRWPSGPLSLWWSSISNILFILLTVYLIIGTKQLFFFTHFWTVCMKEDKQQSLCLFFSLHIWYREEICGYKGVCAIGDHPKTRFVACFTVVNYDLIVVARTSEVGGTLAPLSKNSNQ
jgi:hypothetical protein